MKSIKAALVIWLSLTAGLVFAKDKDDRYFYLTEETHFGDTVTDACGRGYHFASVWELLDLSSLTYNFERGYVNMDSGDGPPAEMAGWVRTGTDWDVSPNCRTEAGPWTDGAPPPPPPGPVNAGLRGWIDHPPWDDPGAPISEFRWRFHPGPCGVPEDAVGVWCISDHKIPK